MVDTVALDSGRGLDDWYLLVAGSLAVGVILAGLLSRAAANLGRGVTRPTVAFGAIAATAWIALFNTGTPSWVAALVAIGLGATAPVLLLVGVDALGTRPDSRAISAVATPAAAALAGAAVGASVQFVDPSIVWSDTTAAGALVAAIGVWRRASLPDRMRDAAPPRPTRPWDRSPAGVRLLLAGTLGVAASAVVRIAPYLDQQWQAGVRYHLLTLALAGLIGAAMLIGSMWLPKRNRRSAATEVDDVARTALLVAGVLLLVAISQTLPGTVIGTGAAAGLAFAGIAVLAATGARGPATTRIAAIGSTGVVGIAAWIAAWIGWPALVDATGSERATIALVAVPALAAGAIASLRPAGAATTVDVTVPSAAASAGPAGAEPLLLDARNVEFSYGAVQVLFGVDLHVRQGEVVALLGTNGAGKTTFLRTVTGLAEPSGGSIRMAGGDLSRFSAADRVLLGINQIASGAAVAPDLTVAENLAMFGHTLPSGEARAGRKRALEVFPKLGERLSQRASSLSGGERQMLALSKSVVLRPRLLIIDECTLGLAPVAVASLVPVIRSLHEDGSSILLVEQSVHLALDLADRACCMEKGRIVYESAADDLRADPGLLEAVYLEGIAAALEHRAGAGSGQR